MSLFHKHKYTVITVTNVAQYWGENYCGNNVEFLLGCDSCGKFKKYKIKGNMANAKFANAVADLKGWKHPVYED